MRGVVFHGMNAFFDVDTDACTYAGTGTQSEHTDTLRKGMCRTNNTHETHKQSAARLQISGAVTPRPQIDTN